MDKCIFIITLLLSLSACTTKTPLPEQVRRCDSPRPEVCPMSYIPACGYSTDGPFKTYSNACSACSENKVIGFLEGVCQG